MEYTNNLNIPLSLAVWLAHDEYDHIEDPNIISATTLIKPIKQLVLTTRVKKEKTSTDLSDLTASRVGTAIHTAIENAWLNANPSTISRLLRTDQKVQINPTKDELIDGAYVIYMEQRSFKEIEGFTVSGKFDFVSNGTLEDFKSTGTFSYITQSNAEKYALQGSIYKWLNPDIIKSSKMKIQYIFTDWSAVKATQDPNYPSHRTIEQEYPLMSLLETENYIKKKLQALKKYLNSPEEDIPECTSEDLWRGNSVFKYYKNPNKLIRSTKNFSTYHEAHAKYIADGSIGTIIEVEDQVKACKYCSALTVCKQAKNYINQGYLLL